MRAIIRYMHVLDAWRQTEEITNPQPCLSAGWQIWTVQPKTAISLGSYWNCSFNVPKKQIWRSKHTFKVQMKNNHS